MVLRDWCLERFSRDDRCLRPLKKHFCAVISEKEPLSLFYNTIKKSTDKPIILYAFALSMIYWLIETLVVHLILLSFGVENIEYLMVIPAYTTSLILGLLSFIPMGIGVIEGSLASFFILMGIEISLSLIIVIIIRISTRWYGVLVGFWALRLCGGVSFVEKSVKT